MQLTLDIDRKQSAFEQYHKANPHIYREFCRIALELARNGRKKYSARDIFPIIRWETRHSGNDGFKVNNNYSPYYARLFEQDHPEHKGFFRKRTSKADQL